VPNELVGVTWVRQTLFVLGDSRRRYATTVMTLAGAHHHGAELERLVFAQWRIDEAGASPRLVAVTQLTAYRQRPRHDVTR
jgi:hypothetical protein